MNHFETPVGWPRVHAECDYRQPLRFEDEVEIHLLVSEKKSKSLSYVFKFRKLNGPETGRSGARLAYCRLRDQIARRKIGRRQHPQGIRGQN